MAQGTIGTPIANPSGESLETIQDQAIANPSVESETNLDKGIIRLNIERIADYDSFKTRIQNNEYFNACVIPFDDKSEIYTGRMRYQEGEEDYKPFKKDEPDYTRMVLWLKRGNDILPLYELKAPQNSGILNLEDVRGIRNPDGTVDFGLTVVYQEGTGFIAKPALMQLQIENGIFKIDDHIKVFENLKGKNFTPIGDKRFFFRQDGQEGLHKLGLYRLTNESAQKKLIKEKEISFPADKIPWAGGKGLINDKEAEGKIGTVAGPPIVINNEGDQLFMLHGVWIENNEFNYGIGFCILDRDFNLKSVSARSLLTAKNFSEISQTIIDLKKSIYCCGFSVEIQDGKRILSLPVSVADRKTLCDERTKFDIDELINNDEQYPKVNLLMNRGKALAGVN